MLLSNVFAWPVAYYAMRKVLERYAFRVEIDRELDEPQYTPLPTVGVRLISILEDSQLHAGQAAYIRGLIEGYGWQKY